MLHSWLYIFTHMSLKSSNSIFLCVPCVSQIWCSELMNEFCFFSCVHELGDESRGMWHGTKRKRSSEDNRLSAWCSDYGALHRDTADCTITETCNFGDEDVWMTNREGSVAARWSLPGGGGGADSSSLFCRAFIHFVHPKTSNVWGQIH